MSNSKNNMEEGSKGTDESAPGANDSTSNKKTRFTKSKSISEVFNQLDIEDTEENLEASNDLNDSSVDEIIPIHNESVEYYDDYSLDEDEEDYEVALDDSYDDSYDEIIPIHNEYNDLDKSEALADESVEGGVIINPDADDLDTENVKESIEFEIEEENTDSIGGEANSDEFSESLSVETDFDELEESGDSDDEDLATEKTGGNELAEDEVKEKIGKSSAQGVLINDKSKASDSKRSFDIFDSSTIISIVGFIVGLAILLIGITYYASSSDRVVDNVLSGETAGLAIFLVIIGLIVIGFSLLKFFSTSKSSLIIDTFNSIKSIDYDDISEDVISREDFDAIFSVFKRKKDSDFSDNDKSVDSSKDLFEKDQDDEVSDDDIDALYSDSNLTSQKNQSSFNEHENADSTEIPQDYDDGDDEIIPIHSKLNEQSEESSLEDKYSKYDFDDESDEDFGEEYDLADDASADDLEEDFDLTGDNQEDSKGDFNLTGDDQETSEDLVDDGFDENLEEEFEEIIDEDERLLEEEADSSIEAERMDGLEDKYSKYDFEDDEDFEEETVSKPTFKKSVDLSQFEKQDLSEEELAEKQRKAEELAEKKRRIIEGTNFDNSLRKE